MDEGPNSSQSVGSEDERVDVEENGLDEEQSLNFEEMESRIKKLEDELREIAALEVSLYSVVPEHGSSAHKVHTPARRLSSEPPLLETPPRRVCWLRTNTIHCHLNQGKMGGQPKCLELNPVMSIGGHPCIQFIDPKVDNRDFKGETRDMYAESRVEPQSGKGVQFPFAVTDRVVIKGNKRTPLRFVGREVVVTTQCLNGCPKYKELMKQMSISKAVLWLVMANPLATTAQPAVLDTAGQALQPGIQYYILPSTTSGGGGLTLVDRNGSCPLYVGQAAQADATGLPVLFNPFVSDETIIRESSDFAISF
ncbi:hypothetical protein IFM89_026271 [Coptis chinensis]|uniref:PUB 62/63 C-terminal domain-containing protein n=1 Tax=Coptis chinensis TaxID=261450 RepID=A0A835M516_9MAGN|nr:hypothetical protein IFM89_026271 [Coptis chinensis]